MKQSNKRKKRRRRQILRRRILLLCGVLLCVALVIGITAGVRIHRQREEQARLDAENRMYREYPLRYQDLIETYAAEFGLDPAFVAALVRTESSFVADAQSSAGALGLMQLLPEAGEWIAFRLSEDFEADWLLDPEFNLRYGCWYLMYLSKIYNGDLTCVAAAYHAGSGAVDDWLEDPAYSQDGQTLTSIPYNQTSIYAETILERYEIYKTLYYNAD